MKILSLDLGVKSYEEVITETEALNETKNLSSHNIFLLFIIFPRGINPLILKDLRRCQTQESESRCYLYTVVDELLA